MASTIPFERPFAARHNIDKIDCIVRCEIAWRLRITRCGKVVGRRAKHPAHAANADGGKRGIRQFGNTHRNVDALVDQVHHTIDEQGIERNVRVAFQQIDKYRRQDDTAE